MVITIVTKAPAECLVVVGLANLVRSIRGGGEIGRTCLVGCVCSSVQMISDPSKSSQIEIVIRLAISRLCSVRRFIGALNSVDWITEMKNRGPKPPSSLDCCIRCPQS